MRQLQLQLQEPCRLLSPSLQPGLHLLCFLQTEFLLLLLLLPLQGWGLLQQRRHRPQALLPLCRLRDHRIPPIQDIPGIAKCPCPWATTPTHMASTICRTHRCITRAPDRLRTQDPSSLPTPSLSPRSSHTIHSSNATTRCWFRSERQDSGCHHALSHTLATREYLALLMPVDDFCLWIKPKAGPHLHI